MNTYKIRINYAVIHCSLRFLRSIQYFQSNLIISMRAFCPFASLLLVSGALCNFLVALPVHFTVFYVIGKSN